LIPLILLRGALAMQTRERSDIDNFYDKRSPLPGEQDWVDGLINEYKDAIPRTRVPSFHYDCHGLTFASRRSGICPSNVVQKILLEDNYKPVLLGDVLPGDIIIYVGSDGEIGHSGIVVELRKSLSGQVIDTCVVSKWGGAHESIHPSRHCPWDEHEMRYYRVCQ
jgi:hypothetical protein